MVPARIRGLIAAIPVVAVSMGLSNSAFADLAPPDECPNMASVGDPCTTAGPSFNENGVCTKTTCTSNPRNPMTFDCLICMKPDAAPPANDSGGPVPTEAGTNEAGNGAGGMGEAGKGAGGAAGSAGPPPSQGGSAGTGGAANHVDAGSPAATSSLDSSSSCTIASVGNGVRAAPWMWSIGGALALAWSARRRRRRSS